MLKVLGLVLLALGGLYLLLLVLMALFQRGMIYHPDPKRGDPAEAGVPEMVPVPLRADDGWPVAGWYAPPRIPGKPTVVFFHGNSGTIASRAFKARVLLDAGYGVFLAEYRGYGGSPGSPSETGLYADGRAVVSWLTARGIPASRIVLYGESLGSGVAMEMTRLIEPMMVVLECPFTSLPDLAPSYVIPGLAHMLMADRYDNLAKIRDLKAPLLIVHGDRDETIPVAQGRALLKAADTIKHGVFLPDAHHNDLWDHGADNHILDFLSRQHD
ncbi:alpha/beta hydrolase [Magnetospirillum sp. SS-4]|uniref:alpha/beta hydrolase n=1 Tax=Magnetospirillum sp. SS-4 TaxID=2681465 RepID=UPI001385DEFE|nr:alpha/beta hydrolase [Magnetospirillum sp. SS-4]CAA7627508.1 Hydrolase of the alpha/beta superfamily [Magnetospirillum sp. SS-4]